MFGDHDNISSHASNRLCGPSSCSSYSILAPNVIPPGFVDGKVVSEKVLTALQLDQNDYRLGHTKVFFKAGVLGLLEDMRDERLSKIVSNFQARIRGYLIRKNYKKLQDQRYGDQPQPNQTFRTSISHDDRDDDCYAFEA